MALSSWRPAGGGAGPRQSQAARPEPGRPQSAVPGGASLCVSRCSCPSRLSAAHRCSSHTRPPAAAHCPAPLLPCHSRDRRRTPRAHRADRPGRGDQSASALGKQNPNPGTPLSHPSEGPSEVWARVPRGAHLEQRPSAIHLAKKQREKSYVTGAPASKGARRPAAHGSYLRS